MILTAEEGCKFREFIADLLAIFLGQSCQSGHVITGWFGELSNHVFGTRGALDGSGVSGALVLVTQILHLLAPLKQGKLALSRSLELTVFEISKKLLGILSIEALVAVQKASSLS
jgi:hypothetical protein